MSPYIYSRLRDQAALPVVWIPYRSKSALACARASHRKMRQHKPYAGFNETPRRLLSNEREQFKKRRWTESRESHGKNRKNQKYRYFGTHRFG